MILPEDEDTQSEGEEGDDARAQAVQPKEVQQPQPQAPPMHAAKLEPLPSLQVVAASQPSGSSESVPATALDPSTQAPPTQVAAQPAAMPEQPQPQPQLKTEVQTRAQPAAEGQSGAVVAKAKAKGKAKGKAKSKAQLAPTRPSHAGDNDEAQHPNGDVDAARDRLKAIAFKRQLSDLPDEVQDFRG